jgi:hypothetical protein
MGVAEELVRRLVVACGVCGPGIQDQPPDGDLLAVLPPEPGTRGVQGGGLVDQRPGLVQFSGPVGLVGSYGVAVGVHATAVARTRGWAWRCPGCAWCADRRQTPCLSAALDGL